MFENFNIPQVSELVSAIKTCLEDQFHEVMVQGEVSNLSLSGAGHWYFTLSDDDSSLSCALFRGDALRNPLINNLKDGDNVIISGPLSVYQRRGTFQILTKKIFPLGEGKLKIQFEQLKTKLTQEGLFDLERKKKIPSYPKKIAVITALGAAALQDFLNVMKRRCLWMDIIIIPSLVQGDAAPESLRKALMKAQKISDVDVIVLTRGGGSIEDLWAFNDEQLVRLISDCPIPLISAVGHQVDFTLSDYVADLRAETPTAAAELLSQSHTHLGDRLNYCQSHLKSSLVKMNQQIQIIIHQFHPRQLLSLIRQMVSDYQRRLEQNLFYQRGEELTGLIEYRRRLDENFLKFGHINELRYTNLENKLSGLHNILNALDPSNVLTRGYTFIKSQDRILSSYADFERLTNNAEFSIYFKDGLGKGKKV